VALSVPMETGFTDSHTVFGTLIDSVRIEEIKGDTGY